MSAAAEDSEEACLVNSQSLTDGILPYTDGSGAAVKSYSQYYGAQMNNVSRMGSGASPNLSGNGSSGNSNGRYSLRQGNGRRNEGRGTGGRGSQSNESESGELIDYNDDILMSQFHSDAIKQIGCGKFQLLATLTIGLGIAGHLIQVYAIPYILPSAELEYCIVEQKSWLGLITFLGLGCGSLFWGGVAGQAGRRKTLLTCLAVSNIFSVIAAFMPTYGPFMMARFCAAAGVGGALPAGTCYLCETSTANARSNILSLLSAIGLSGAIFAGGLAIIMVPETGQEVVEENKEHFSAWHRYLLVVLLPTFGAILGLFWLPESPRWLLDSGHEVDALSIYQKIFQTNKTRGGYTLTELELPGTRTQRQHIPSSVLAGMAFSLQKFFNSFLQLFRKSHAKTTILIFISWVATLFVFHGLTIFIAEHSKALEDVNFNRRTLTTYNHLYENISINKSIENRIYSNTKFTNCTFRRIFISHVLFDNCTFIDTEFSNVKTSRTSFLNSNFDGLKLIDTDLTERHFINCTKNNTEIVRLSMNCDQDFEYNIFLNAIWRSNLGSLIPSFVYGLVVGEFIHKFGRSRMATTCFAFATMLSCGFGFLFIDDHVNWTGGNAQGFILGGLIALTVLSIENYNTSLRCSALGLFVCGGHLGALIASPIYSSLPFTSSNFASALSTFSMIIPVISTAALKDPCTLL